MRRLAIPLAIGLAGLIIALQGWQARGPDSDVIAAMVRAVALIDRGHIPQRGTRSDLWAFRPPGTSWLAVPGVALFEDPRLAELTGSAGLYLATLPGVFLLTRRYFGGSAAVVATLLYAFSGDAINLAAQLQPKAHPFFCVWMFYCAALWVERRDSRWLATAVVFWAAGMYVHLEMAPLILALPVLWWRERPPIGAAPMLAGAAIVLVLWAPYLIFERGRDFLDLRSQLLLRPLAAVGVETIEMCGDAPMAGESFANKGLYKQYGLAARLRGIGDLSVSNLQTRVPGGVMVLVLCLLAGVWLARGEGPRVLVVLFLVPWAVLVLLSGDINRTIGLLPLQCALIAAFVVSMKKRITAAVYWPAAGLIIAMMATNPVTLGRVRDWQQNGWSGQTPAEVWYLNFRQVRCEEETALD